MSYQTVSKVLNGQAHVLPQTAERVWQAARQLGYQPHHNARNLRAQRSRMIGYSWMPLPPGQMNPILDQFLSSMVEEAEAAGYHLLPFPYREGDGQIPIYRELIETGRVDGFVLTNLDYHDPRVLYLLERQFPFVAFGRSDPELIFPYVDVDNEAGERMATEHLLALGHRRIAAISWLPNSRVGDERLKGYLAAMQAASVEAKPEWIARGEGTVEFARQAAEQWLSGPDGQRPSGIAALSDAMAIGVMHAARARGLVIGRDLAIAGFDDAPMSQYLWPPLTSVRQPIREAGHKCVEALVARLEDRPLAEEHILLKPELIVRGSSVAF